jgi:hypothetical protein
MGTSKKDLEISVISLQCTHARFRSMCRAAGRSTPTALKATWPPRAQRSSGCSSRSGVHFSDLATLRNISGRLGVVLFIPQRRHRIQVRRSPRRHYARCNGYQPQSHHRRRQRFRIVRLKSKQQRRRPPSRREECGPHVQGLHHFRLAVQWVKDKSFREPERGQNKNSIC